MEDINELTEKIGSELKAQLEAFEDLEIGSDEQRKAMDALEKTTSSYKMLIEIQNESEKNKNQLELQKAELEERKQSEKRKYVLDRSKVIFGGVFVVSYLSNAVKDYLNGEVKSKALSDMGKEVMNYMLRHFIK